VPGRDPQATGEGAEEEVPGPAFRTKYPYAYYGAICLPFYKTNIWLKLDDLEGKKIFHRAKK